MNPCPLPETLTCDIDLRDDTPTIEVNAAATATAWFLHGGATLMDANGDAFLLSDEAAQALLAPVCQN